MISSYDINENLTQFLHLLTPAFPFPGQSCWYFLAAAVRTRWEMVRYLQSFPPTRTATSGEEVCSQRGYQHYLWAKIVGTRSKSSVSDFIKSNFAYFHYFGINYNTTGRIK